MAKAYTSVKNAQLAKQLVTNIRGRDILGAVCLSKTNLSTLEADVQTQLNTAYLDTFSAKKHQTLQSADIYLGPYNIALKLYAGTEITAILDKVFGKLKDVTLCKPTKVVMVLVTAH